MRIESQPALVLHTRLYRDTSLLVEFITADYGRISGVVKGVRGAGKTAKQRRSIMQPFVPLSISWSGNTDLKTIHQFEASAAPVRLSGERLFSGIYVNELFTRLIQHYDGQARWFDLYQHVLLGLSSQQTVEVVLRCFELELLQELGYGIDLTMAGDTESPVLADQSYYLDVDHGLVSCESIQDRPAAKVFTGRDLLAVAAGDFSGTARRCAKRLCRQMLAPHLGDKPLKSRELFS